MVEYRKKQWHIFLDTHDVWVLCMHGHSTNNLFYFLLYRQRSPQIKPLQRSYCKSQGRQRHSYVNMLTYLYITTLRQLITLPWICVPQNLTKWWRPIILKLLKKIKLLGHSDKQWRNVAYKKILYMNILWILLCYNIWLVYCVLRYHLLSHYLQSNSPSRISVSQREN